MVMDLAVLPKKPALRPRTHGSLSAAIFNSSFGTSVTFFRLLSAAGTHTVHIHSFRLTHIQKIKPQSLWNLRPSGGSPAHRDTMEESTRSL